MKGIDNSFKKIDSSFKEYEKALKEFSEKNKQSINPIHKFYFTEVKETSNYFVKEHSQMINRLNKQLEKYYESLKDDEEYSTSYNHRDVLNDTLLMMEEDVEGYVRYLQSMNEETVFIDNKQLIQSMNKIEDAIQLFKKKLKKE